MTEANTKVNKSSTSSCERCETFLTPTDNKTCGNTWFSEIQMYFVLFTLDGGEVSLCTVRDERSTR